MMRLGYSLGLPRQYYEPIINNNARNVVQPFVNVVNSWYEKQERRRTHEMQERTAKGLSDATTGSFTSRRVIILALS